MESVEKINSLVAEYNTYHEKYLIEMDTAVKKYFSEFFELHPEIPKVVWTQYTPYWNDGESTEFETNFYQIFTDVDEDDYDYDDDEDEDEEKSTESDTTQEPKFEYTVAIKNLEAKTCQYLKSIPQEVFEYMFGDHVKVVATKKGFEVEEYDHS